MYLKIDVLQLADVIESFRNTYYNEYGLDCTQYLTFPSISWDAALKYSKQTLELLSNEQKDMFEEFEYGIRGGISTITHRYAEANNKYMKNYDKDKPSSYLIYPDVNNQYGQIMMEELPVAGFERMDLEKDDWLQIVDTPGKGCYLTVDLEIPKNLHEKFKELPLAPEHLNKKLIPTLLDKTHYHLHGDNLKYYLEEGLILKKIHRGIEFNTKAWLKGYIENNTRLRTKANNDFEKNLWKKANNAVFGKTMENVRKRRNIEIVTNEKEFTKLASRNTFVDFCHLEDLNPNVKEGVTLVEMAKSQ